METNRENAAAIINGLLACLSFQDGTREAYKAAWKKEAVLFLNQYIEECQADINGNKS